MKAVQLLEYGEPSKVLAVRDAHLPEPARGEVRVRMLARPVNPSDLLFARGRYPHDPPEFPGPIERPDSGMRRFDQVERHAVLTQIAHRLAVSCMILRNQGLGSRPGMFGLEVSHRTRSINRPRASAFPTEMISSAFWLVGAAGFEPATTRTPSVNQGISPLSSCALRMRKT